MDLTAATGHAGQGWVTEATIVALGAAIAVAVGVAALGRMAPAAAGGARSTRSSRPGSRLAPLPLAGTAGLALLTPLLYLLWRLGLPAAPAVVVGAATALIAGFGALHRLRGRRPAAPRDPDPGATGAPASDASPSNSQDGGGSAAISSAVRRWLPGLPAALALGAFLWKLTRVPLWSWDHYAIWGVKARRMFPEGIFDPGWATPGGVARPDYPLGLPLAWRALTLGAEPGAAAFVTAHALMATALVALTGWAATRLAHSRLAGAAAAALVAASPLLWDTESLGLADLPLALWAVAAVAVVASRPGTAAEPVAAEPASRPAAAAPLWVAGLCLGFLPWIKTEGLTLALGLGVASLAVLAFRPSPHSPRGGRASARGAALAVVLPALALGAAGLLATPGLGDREIGFFRGDWAGRGLERLSEAPRLAAALAGDLTGLEWLGIWWLFAAVAAAAVVSLVRHRRRAPAGVATAFALAAVVTLQLALYLATYLVSYIPPDRHAATSFHRVAAALAPLALLAAAAAFGAVGGTAKPPGLSRAAAAPRPADGGRGSAPRH